MFGIPKLMILIAVVISTILFWAASNVCRYNFALEKKTNILNIVTEDIDPNLGNAKVYYFEELNCSKVDLDWDINRIVKNFQTLNVILYQELTTDIRGNPNYWFLLYEGCTTDITKEVIP